VGDRIQIHPHPYTNKKPSQAFVMVFFILWTGLVVAKHLQNNSLSEVKDVFEKSA